MSSEERLMRGTTTARMPRPLIIGHNCGYEGYDKNIYSKAATERAYKDCDYLEIDLTSKEEDGEVKWWYFHDGRPGKGRRKDGVPFDRFLRDFKLAARKWDQKLAANKVKLKPGIFLDLKKRLKQSEVNALMEFLNDKYKRKCIPEGTPLMIFTGRGGPRLGVYRHITLYFVKWLYKSRKKKEIMKRRYCPRLTLVTREIKDIRGRGLAYWKGILEPFRKLYLKYEERNWFLQNLSKKFKRILKAIDKHEILIGPFRKSYLEDEERDWFLNNLNKKKLWWAFNPELFWLLRYDFAEIIENEIAVIPWFETNLSKFRKFLWKIRHREEREEPDMAAVPKKLGESDSGWIKVILGIFAKYWLYKSYHLEDVKPLLWGIITFAPNLLKDAFQRYSFPARLVGQVQP